MHRNPDRYDRGYLRLLAAVFVLLCGLSTLRYLWIDLLGGGSVPLVTQIVCLLFTVSGIVYFIRPRLGHHALLGLTSFVLLTHAGSGPPSGDVFWYLVLGFLLLPYLPTRRRLASP